MAVLKGGSSSKQSLLRRGYHRPPRFGPLIVSPSESLSGSRTILAALQGRVRRADGAYSMESFKHDTDEEDEGGCGGDSACVMVSSSNGRVSLEIKVSSTSLILDALLIERREQLGRGQ